MHRRRVFAVVGVLSFLSVVSVVGQGAQQPPQVRIETLYPRHAVRGQTTVIHVAVPSRDTVQAVEISPATGVTVASFKGNSSETEQAIGWWEVTLNVAKDAPLGDRSLMVVMKMSGRSFPITISVPTHLPAISNLRIGPTLANQPTFELQVAVADSANDLGQSPYVWFMADCGGEPIPGAVPGKVSAGVVRAIVPNLRTVEGDGIPPVGKCDVEVRVTDSMGIESNTLRTAVEFKN